MERGTGLRTGSGLVDFLEDNLLEEQIERLKQNEDLWKKVGIFDRARDPYGVMETKDRLLAQLLGGDGVAKKSSCHNRTSRSSVRKGGGGQQG